MVYILHIDTSTDKSTVFLAADGLVKARKENEEAKNHAAILNNDIKQVISESGIDLTDINAIAVCGGPGSYTGLRISLSAAKAMCYVLDKPLLMHNRLLLMLLGHYYRDLSAYKTYFSILNARAAEYFISLYDDNLNAVIAPQHAFEDDLISVSDDFIGNTLTCGAIPETLKQRSLNRDMDFDTGVNIDMDAWAKFALDKFNCNEFVNLSAAEPFYLKQVYTHNSKKIN